MAAADPTHVPPATGIDAPAPDRFMDFLRAAALAVVVAGHWLVLIPYVRDGVVGGRILYDVEPAFWPLTWVFDVLPLFFFVGGFANFTSYMRRGRPRTDQAFRSRRLLRLLRPTLVFLAVWVLIEVVLALLGVGGDTVPRGMRLGRITPFEALWFLGVYLVVVLLSPLTIRLHLRLGAAVPVAVVAAVAGFDALAFGTGRPSLLAVNVILVWLLPHQLGYFYADGRLARPRAPWIAAAGAVALLATWLLSELPWYGRNMLDNGATVIGITAPTLPFATTCVWVVAASLLLRPAISRLLGHTAAWRPVARFNSVAMTVFLWHMTAYFAVVVLLAAIGVELPQGPTAVWWLERPLFLVLSGAALAPLVLVFSRFEHAVIARAPGPKRLLEIPVPTLRDRRPSRRRKPRSEGDLRHCRWGRGGTEW